MFVLADKLSEVLRELQFDVVRNPPPDGACQFDAVSHQLLTVKSATCGPVSLDASSLRENVVKYLKENESSFVDFISVSSSEKYLTDMGDPKTHGDHITLLALSRLFSVQFLVLCSLGVDKTVLISPDASQTLQAFMLIFDQVLLNV